MAISPISYDSRAILIHGERTLLLSGAIHYPRSTPTMWPELMKRSKEAGLNTIETYVFWNLHEVQEGQFDFSDRLNLYHFCELAQEHGLHVILRIGPYICAETNYGGFPAWLREVPEIQMRTYNQPFMQAMERWVRFLVNYVRPLFADQGGPIILAQLENEYNLIGARYGDEGKRYLQWVSDLGADLQLGVPLIMCVGAAQGAIETMNGFYSHDQIEDHFAKHPDQPAIWTENWPGWYDTFSHPHHVRTPEDVAYGVARFIAAGGTGVNYYMWHGGTNFGRESMYLQTTSYDFTAPLNEFGDHTTKSRHLGRLHELLYSYSSLLLTEEQPAQYTLGELQRAYVYGENADALVFLCNDNFEEAPVAWAQTTYTLPPRSVLILSKGQQIFHSAEIKAEDRVEQTFNIEPQAISHISWCAEPRPQHWPETLQQPLVSTTPIEQLTYTHDQTDYCWYTTDLFVSVDQTGPGTLTLTGVADVVHVFVNGELQATTQTPLTEDRGALDGPHFTQTFTFTLEPGHHKLELLCCSLGLIKGDWMIDANMVEERKGLWGNARWNGRTLEGPWSIQPGLAGEQTALFGAGATLATWEDAGPKAIASPLYWWKIAFTRPTTEGALVVDLTGMRKGLAWLNGRCIGRYWLVAGNAPANLWHKNIILTESSEEPSQRYYHLPAEWLQEQNTLVLFEELGGNPASVTINSIEYK
ncbi:beta-galactosidase [Tengunoibacter tsumagoiensis]|uniref:Beta-galactosidase n=1 Tax=Tengunoibacter tsumagoiensis TaxID=2014871 RepID=A0A402A3N1_9CHLR|nr:beta-galactosidase [Tengunoibacter tsumagoiensis]GCE13601.1 hypothetical protein KTT_34600 [Tengunoibacter tsumagoiensis]